MREDRPIRTAALNASESRTDAIALARAGVASIAMLDAQFYTAATDSGTTSSDWINAGIAIVVSIVIARIVDRVIAKRGATVGELVSRGEMSAATKTRLRVTRRLVSAGIILIGVAVAASNFDELSSVAKGILASSAVLGLVVGFAARQTLANAIAGILLAITQPIRIGDLVTFEEETGEVEDMKLTYTYIRLGDGRRLIVPNERLAQSSVVNHTIAERRVQVEVSVWLPVDADLDKAMELIADEDAGISVTVAETDKDGVRLSATTWASSPRSAGGPRPSCARDGSDCCASTHYPQRRPERGFAPELLMTQRQRKQRRRRRHHTGRNSVLLGLGVLTVVAVIGVLAAVGYVLAIAATAPDLSELKPADKGQLSVVYAADGSRLGFIQSDVLRRVVPWRDIPVNIRRATVAIEDERFYKHGGVDLNAIVRAGIKNLESGKTVQGGSTITQQLVRALYIKDPKRNFTRKIREAKLASELEDKHSKTWVLHNYLNAVPYGTVGGRTAIGIEAAAVTFFNRPRGGSGCTRPPCSPASRRHRPSTTRSGTRRPRSPAATRCSARWRRTATSRRPRPRGRRSAGSGCGTARATSSAASPTSPTTSRKS